MAAGTSEERLGYLPSFAGTPDQDLEAYIRSVKIYYYSFKKTLRELVGPRLLGALRGEAALALEKVNPEDLVRDDGYLKLIVHLQSAGFGTKRIFKKPEALMAYGRPRPMWGDTPQK